MATSSSVSTFIHRTSHLRRNSNYQIRNLTKDGDNGSGELKLHVSLQLSHSNAPHRGDFTEIAKEICKITRTKPRWEQTLISDYPSFNFYDPQFFHEFLNQQDNVLLSLRFFRYLYSHRHEFHPDPVSCNKIFDSLVRANACSAAKSLLDDFNFSPDPGSLERYVQSLCEDGMIKEATDELYELRRLGFCPSIETWNLALFGCLKLGKTDLIWKLYQDMIESNVLVDLNVNTIGYLIQAFCYDKKFSNAYELLRKVLEDGRAPHNASFNKLISGFCVEKDYIRVSELLHTMIAKNCAPDIFTYQEVINGLCKRRKGIEGFRVFNDLKDRGYAPDVVMYTTMINGLCKMRWIGEARKLWFEMIGKGFVPNEYTYNALINGFCKIGDLEEAKRLYKEMCDRGYRESTISCNTMIYGLCLHGRANEALELFEEMPNKGLLCDLITYNSLIQGLCKEGKIVESRKMFKKLLEQGLEPSVSSYTPIIEKLCQTKGVLEAKELWNDMRNRGLEPMAFTRDHIISGLCDQGLVMEGMEWLVTMLRSKLQPKSVTFEKMLHCLLEMERIDDSLLVVDFMFRIGYRLKECLCYLLVRKLCNEARFVQTSLAGLLDRN